MKDTEIESYFCRTLDEDENVSFAVAAIRTLMNVLENDTADTVQEMDANFQSAVEVMRTSEFPVTGIQSGCELFLRFITLAKLDTKTFEECKRNMLFRGKLFLNKLSDARGKVTKLAAPFVADGSKIMTHSKSRVVLEAMKEAAQANKRFEVFITTSNPDKSGLDMAKQLEEANIPCTIIIDAAIGHIMEQVDFVLVGAEGVVESGGIINKVGTYTMAICAREMKKPFYVLTESFKFVRLYPLNQLDLSNESKFTSSMTTQRLDKLNLLVDYTPPSYITLLFTDLGILTPSAISDELVKLYL